MVLPIELVGEVALHSADDPPTLCALATTCKTIRRYVETVLYEHPHTRGFLPTAGLFLQLHRRSDLAERVKTLTVEVEDHFAAVNSNLEQLAIASGAVVPPSRPTIRCPEKFRIDFQRSMVVYANMNLPLLRHCVDLKVDLSNSALWEGTRSHPLSARRVSQWMSQCTNLKTLRILGQATLSSVSGRRLPFELPATLSNVHLTVHQPLPKPTRPLPFLTLEHKVSRESLCSASARWQPLSLSINRLPSFGFFNTHSPYMHLEELIIKDYQQTETHFHTLFFRFLRLVVLVNFPNLKRISIHLRSYPRDEAEAQCYKAAVKRARRHLRHIGISLEIADGCSV